MIIAVVFSFRVRRQLEHLEFMYKYSYDSGDHGAGDFDESNDRVKLLPKTTSSAFLDASNNIN